MIAISRFRPSVLHTGITSAVVLAVAALAGCSEKASTTTGRGRSTTSSAAPVLVGKAQRKVVPVFLDAIGSVESIRTAAIRSQVTGVLLKVAFAEGQEVAAGDPLFEIDPRSFKNALLSAEADRQKIQTQLETAEADVTRYRALSEQGMVSKEQYLSLQNNARALRAALGASEASVANARLQLEFCSIKAPIAGRTGGLGAHEGDLVRASDSSLALVTLNQLSPIYVTFAVPQQYLPALNRYRAAGKVEVAATPPGTAETPETGQLSFVDNAIDATTGTLKLKATFANENHRLWPGQSVTVRLVLASPEVLVVPATAVQNDQKGQHVYVVKADGTAELREVTVERSNETDAVIAGGLKEGETVVTDGQLRVLPGRPVEIKTPEGSAPAATPPAAKGTGSRKRS